jgi:KaiC/GvpD/RAD55 family RecA-like ATPase
MKKVKTGIYGLNSLLYGGFIRNSSTVVIGRAGAGKTTFAIQFMRRGLESGQEAVFVSLDENREQIIEEAVAMGWSEILDYIDRKRLSFIDASGRNFANFIRSELPAFVDEWKGSDMRVAIDPLTPVMWSTKDEYEQRELIGSMIKQMKKLGTVLCTLEEHGVGDLAGREVIIPMYLADCVIHLRYGRWADRRVRRSLEIVKCRNSRHSELSHAYVIVKGFGLVVGAGDFKTGRQSPITGEHLERLEKEELPERVKKKIVEAANELREEDIKNFKREDFLKNVMDEYMESTDDD